MIDFGTLSHAETIAILKEAMDNLDAIDIANAIKEMFDTTDRGEIAAQIEGE